MSKSAYDCQGCSLCLLSCPMWMQQRDVLFSPQGVFKALQAGADMAETMPALDMCVDCGACAVLCPENIQIGDIFNDMRQKMSKTSEKPSFKVGDDAFQLILAGKVQDKIKNTDFYVISAPSFHANHAQRVAHYTQLQQETGCSINLDLQRNAIVTGIATNLDVEQQVAWLLQGRVFTRIIVEDAGEQKQLEHLSGKPVVHIAQLISEAN